MSFSCRVWGSDLLLKTSSALTPALKPWTKRLEQRNNFTTPLFSLHFQLGIRPHVEHVHQSSHWTKPRSNQYTRSINGGISSMDEPIKAPLQEARSLPALEHPEVLNNIKWKKSKQPLGSHWLATQSFQSAGHCNKWILTLPHYAGVASTACGSLLMYRQYDRLGFLFSVFLLDSAGKYTAERHWTDAYVGSQSRTAWTKQVDINAPGFSTSEMLVRQMWLLVLQFPPGSCLLTTPWHSISTERLREWKRGNMPTLSEQKPLLWLKTPRAGVPVLLYKRKRSIILQDPNSAPSISFHDHLAYGRGQPLDSLSSWQARKSTSGTCKMHSSKVSLKFISILTQIGVKV